MIVFLKSKISKSEADELFGFLKSRKISFEEIRCGETRFLYLCSGIDNLKPGEPENFSAVKRVSGAENEHPLVSSLDENFAVKIKNHTVSKKHFAVMAGPCTISSEEEADKIASALSKSGVKFLRGGTFKLRTSPYSFGGLGKEGVDILQKIAQKYDMISITELTEISQIEFLADKIDILQVGTRNMQNYPLLRELGHINNPVILKRGMSSSLKEWLLAAEHIIKSGNSNVILCERGIKTFENYTRNTLDISAVSALKNMCGLPVIVDPSHSTGRSDMIKSVSWAATAAGADGIIVETHFNPDSAICDSRQHITVEELNSITEKLPVLMKLWDKEKS
ncbi:MAG: 3-deoxy-7-phosphoheptulonate synthase [Candidatus Cloacimonadota bacterium]|nr:MAG: 3-deoxy-7-phosphoheptulonate synthase [Candidatus Cloacimonadota bacterium]